MGNISTESNQKNNLLTDNEITSISENSLQNSNIDNNPTEIYTKKEKIKLKKETVEEIFEKIEKDQSLKVYNSYRIKRSKNIFSLEDDNNKFEVHYLFKRDLVINYKNAIVSNIKITLVEKSVKSSIQIEKTMEAYNIKSLIYENKQYRSFPVYKNILFDMVDSDTFTINFLCVMDELKYICDNTCIKHNPETIDLNSLSIYANKYLKYTENNIDYIQTEERSNFFSCLNDFIYNPDVNFFKITGPSNDGKTITLLLFSRTRNNIIYFNLKYLMCSYHSRNIDYLKVMIYELGRALLTTKQVTDIEKIFKEITFIHPWQIISQITELLKGEEKIIILDQFKEKTIDFTIYNNIEKNFTEKEEIKLKLIICSSINDTFIKLKLLNTIKDFHGNPRYLSKECQEYYFYFCNLLGKEKLKQYYQKINKTSKYYDDFSYNPKYVFMFSKTENQLKTLNEIKEHLIEGVETNYKEKGVSYKEILFLVSLNIGKELDYVNDYNILMFIPLKYFTLEFQEKFFKINYYFKYMKEIIEEIKIDSDVEDFFQKEKYNNSNFYKLLQPHYFEESCINSMKNGDILPSKNCHEIYVKTIAELEEDKKYTPTSKNLYQKSEEEISLREYCDKRIKFIEKILGDNNLKEKKEEEDIIYHSFQALKVKKEKFQNFLKKKRFKSFSEEGVEEEVDIDENKIKIYEYEDSFNNGGILINQINKFGKTLDFGFLYGEKDSKIF